MGGKNDEKATSKSSQTTLYITGAGSPPPPWPSLASCLMATLSGNPNGASPTMPRPGRDSPKVRERMSCEEFKEFLTFADMKEMDFVSKIMYLLVKTMMNSGET